MQARVELESINNGVARFGSDPRVQRVAVLELLECEDVGNVSYVGLQVHLAVPQMYGFAQPGQGGRKYHVSGRLALGAMSFQTQPPAVVLWMSTTVVMRASRRCTSRASCPGYEQAYCGRLARSPRRM
jgi:hypothetical protein